VVGEQKHTTLPLGLMEFLKLYQAIRWVRVGKTILKSRLNGD
jgi:hypothetical protein